MRITVLTLLGVIGLVSVSTSARAVPFGPQNPAVGPAPGVVQVWGGCGIGWHPVPAHWARWGRWVRPHCAPNVW